MSVRARSALVFALASHAAVAHASDFTPVGVSMLGAGLGSAAALLWLLAASLAEPLYPRVVGAVLALAGAAACWLALLLAGGGACFASLGVPAHLVLLWALVHAVRDRGA